MEKKTNKAKLEIFKFLRKSAESQGLALDKNSRAFNGNSINIHFRVFFACKIHICLDENSAK